MAEGFKRRRVESCNRIEVVEASDEINQGISHHLGQSFRNEPT